VKNGAVQPRSGDVRQFLDDKASGLGVVRFDKKNRSITIECWPYLADVTTKGTQMQGWPVTVGMLDNYARQPAAYLPTLNVSGVKDPVVQIVDEANDEIVYTLRIAGQRWRPHVFAPGRYTVRVSEPETRRERVVKGVVAGAEVAGTLDVRL
jgi:alkaline phosphatase D